MAAERYRLRVYRARNNPSNPGITEVAGRIPSGERDYVLATAADRLEGLLQRWYDCWLHEHGDPGPSDWQACAEATRQLLAADPPPGCPSCGGSIDAPLPVIPVPVPHECNDPYHQEVANGDSDH